MDERHAAQTIRAVLGAAGKDSRETLVIAGVDRAGAVVALATVPLDVDVPPLVVPDIAREVEGRLVANGAVSAIAVAVTAQDMSLGCELADDIARHWWGLAMPHQWSVHGGAYREPGCADAACCPPGGKPLELASTSAPGDRRRAARAGDRFLRRREASQGTWRTEAWGHVRAVFDGDHDALAVGKANAALADVRVRDALIVWWASGDSDAAQDVLRGRDTAGVGDALDSLVGDTVVAPPASAVEGCRALAAYARPRELIVVDALRAVLCWRSGDDDGARRLAQSALASDPSYTLAALVSRLASVRGASSAAPVPGA